MGDLHRIEHVLSNLLSNAIKFTDAASTTAAAAFHSMHPVIEIAVVYERFYPGFITFSVRDHGSGISLENQEKLFQPYSIVPQHPGEVQKRRGTGLGLSICKTIVTLLGGTIGCQSKVKTLFEEDPFSGGSEFYFNLSLDTAPDNLSDTVMQRQEHRVREREEEEYAGILAGKVKPWTNECCDWLQSLRDASEMFEDSPLPLSVLRDSSFPFYSASVSNSESSGHRSGNTRMPLRPTSSTRFDERTDSCVHNHYVLPSRKQEKKQDVKQ
jgi:anti-sigma regulatory factor (Ser/Thr protein kinase)